MYKSLTFFFLIVILFSTSCGTIKNQDVSQTKVKEKQRLPFEKNPNSTPSYHEVISAYKSLAAEHKMFQFNEFGITDSGHPLHYGVLSKSKNFNPVNLHKEGKLILFVNNAIHPGEPCGVDATMILVRDYLSKPSLMKLLDEVVLVFIPVYNIGGALNRGSFSRANQEGPEAYGFRGNAKNLDLNRDFIKCDSRNAQSFNQLFNLWNPHVFIDNHTSNGADYQYTLTLIATQKDKLNRHLKELMQDEMLPDLYQEMKSRDWEMTPYVYARSTPDEGIAGFLDLPRYSSGYACLHNCISFMPETHMLKPFKDRVSSVYHFMDVMINWMNENGQQIKIAKEKADMEVKDQSTFDLNWTLDFDEVEQINFKGYEAKYKPSLITGQSRLYYDREAPYEKKIPFYNSYKPTASVEKPAAYIIPQAYYKVIERLVWNNVEMERLKTDIVFEGELNYIKEYETRKTAYEGHFLHSNIQLEKKLAKRKYYKGDYLIRMNQSKNRYIVETLEANAPDSYFAWNFFDGILMQKEYYSAYVFEERAMEILDADPSLKLKFNEKKRTDEEFANNARAQLNFIYQSSEHYEKTYKQYPVLRLQNEDLEKYF